MLNLRRRSERPLQYLVDREKVSKVYVICTGRQKLEPLDEGSGAVYFEPRVGLAQRAQQLVRAELARVVRVEVVEPVPRFVHGQLLCWLRRHWREPDQHRLPRLRRWDAHLRGRLTLSTERVWWEARTETATTF